MAALVKNYGENKLCFPTFGEKNLKHLVQINLNENNSLRCNVSLYVTLYNMCIFYIPFLFLIIQ